MTCAVGRTDATIDSMTSGVLPVRRGFRLMSNWLLAMGLGLACSRAPSGGKSPTGGAGNVGQGGTGATGDAAIAAGGRTGDTDISATGGETIATGGGTTALGGVPGNATGGAGGNASGGAGGNATGGAGGNATGGAGGNATGGAGGNANACVSYDLPIDASGWVDLASTSCGLQGKWWWAKDEGTTVDGTLPDVPPYVPGQGMCLKGRTVADPTGAAWGAMIGLDLNADAVAGWNATAQNVVGFDVQIAGTSAAELRLEFESTSGRTTSPPFVAVVPGRKVALIDRAIVPATWDVPNRGEKADPTNLRKLQLHIVGGGASAADFDVCITRVRPIVANCTDYAMVEAQVGKLYNNVWGKQDGTDYSQCVFAAGTGTDTQFGWLWRWPVATPTRQVRAYPEIITGESPWVSLSSANGLPAPWLAVISLRFDLDLDVGVDDAYNFAPRVWLTTGQDPTSSNVTQEVVFWLIHNNMTPPGSVVGTYSTGSVDYDVWIDPQHDPGGETTTAGWPYIAFVARTPVRSGPIGVGGFLQYLYGKGYITWQGYVAGIELGTEIVNGHGSVIISNFSASASP